MRLEKTLPLLAVIAFVAPVRAVPPIPPARRIEAEIVRRLAVPGDRAMHMPTDVAIDGSGRVYVADGTNDRVVRFAADGTFELALTGAGTETLSRPLGLTLDGDERLWIADTGRHRLVLMTPDGTVIETINLPEGKRPCDPTDVVVARDGRQAYIVDNDNHRVLVRNNEDGRFEALGRFGRAPGQLQWPFMICLDGGGGAYVTEAVGARVQRLDPSHRWVGELGGWGVQLGRFHRPKGVATDAAGRVYVSDSTLGVVQVFEPHGQVRGVLTGGGGRPLRFNHPMGIAFDSSGRLYVVELGTSRVAVVAMTASSTATQSAPATGTGGSR